MSYLKKAFSRRNFLKGFLVSIFASQQITESSAASNSATLSLVKTTTSALTFSVLANTGGKAYLEYSYSKGSLNKKTSTASFTKSVPKAMSISGLKSNTTVYFRLRFLAANSKTYSSLPISSASTGVELSSNIFAVQADPHMDENSSSDIYNATLDQVVAASPAFLMDLGDIFMVDKLTDKSESNIRAQHQMPIA